MTPAERIAAWFLAEWHAEYLAECLNLGTTPDPEWEPHAGMRWQAAANADRLMTAALCPKGERVVLDRTGDTDRLVKQRLSLSMGVWLDVDSDGAL